MDIIEADSITVSFNTEGGIIDDLAIAASASGGSRPLRPLHRAPWLDSGEALPDGIASVERRLAGDFFCAPFAETSDDVAIHGWAANGNWESAGSVTAPSGAVTASYGLAQTIRGAKLTKRITLCPGQPIVYQSHDFDGGAGLLPVAHHVMLHVPGGAALSFSRKLGGHTAVGALETDPARGRSILAYPQRFEGLGAVRRADGGTLDARNYPFDHDHEDLLFLSEAPGTALAWSAAVAARDGFVFFAVKDASLLPQTVLWMSNGGRFYPPWNSRHRAVIGIEEAATALHLTGADADDPARALATGIALEQDGITAIRYAFGAIAVPPGWTRIADIRVAENTITLVDEGGAALDMPFLGAHFRIGSR